MGKALFLFALGLAIAYLGKKAPGNVRKWLWVLAGVFFLGGLVVLFASTIVATFKVAAAIAILCGVLYALKRMGVFS